MEKKKSDELVIANKELAFQKQEKKDRAAELIIANKELIFQNKEKENRAAELVIANKELLFQNEEKENRAAELFIANKELAFQNVEKENRAAELFIANKELLFQNEEKEKRAAELVIANKELLFQNEEKEKRAAELVIANKELAFQNIEKENRAAELVIANKELAFQNIEKNKREKENIELEAISNSVKQASQYARSLIEASLDPLVTISPEGKITDVNEASVKATGVPRLQLIGTDFSDYFTEPQKAREGYKQVFEKEYVSDYPLTIHHKSGQLTDVLYNASVYKDAKGNVLGVFAAARDVTAQKKASKYAESLIEALAESEKQFRNMMETIPQIAWTNNTDGEVTFYNQRWYDYTGLNYDTSMGWGWLSVVHPDDLQSTLDAYKLILKNNVGGEFQNKKIRADGMGRWHLIRLMPIKNEEGKVQLWTGTATDIHELRLLQQQKDDFISIASHELKTPITSLKTSLQLLNRIKNEPASDMLPNLIEQANKSLEKVIALIKYLLDASNVNEGQLRLDQKLFKLSHVINECCHSINIESTFNIITEGDMELQVYADAERINQVVINFVTNAIKYAPESKEIRIRIEKANDLAKVSVLDKGPGIPSEKLAHLFDRYYRADNSGSQYSGLGLGLYISAEIIKKHGGQMGVRSELGKGSTFWFTLPVEAPSFSF
ncbi:hypothetical protein BH09BAC2_BH09BAC2_04160 [soil metagenome]